MMTKYPLPLLVSMAALLMTGRAAGAGPGADRHVTHVGTAASGVQMPVGSGDPDESAVPGAADLVDAGESWRGFVPLKLQAGTPAQSFEVFHKVGNAGAESSVAVVISFYASEDEQIDRADYLIAEDTLPAIGPGGWLCNRVETVFPLDIPPGQYYVGYMIDSGDDLAEDDEANNTVCIESCLLELRGSGIPGLLPLQPGDTVVLLEDNPPGGKGLRAGRAGTVLCCDADDCPGRLRVSWDLWYGGGRNEDTCEPPTILAYPGGSAFWLDPATTRVGRPFDRCGTLREGLEGCVYFDADDGATFNLAGPGDLISSFFILATGDYVRVRGILDTSAPRHITGRVCPAADADVLHPIISVCEGPDALCVDPPVCGVRMGDRVVLTSSDEPHGAVGLLRGTMGTVICFDPRKERSLLVSWDLWSNGHEDYYACLEHPIGVIPVQSAWWVCVTDVATRFESRCGVLDEMTLYSGGACVLSDGVGLLTDRDQVVYLPDITATEGLPRETVFVRGLHTAYGSLMDCTVSGFDGAGSPLDGIVLHSIVLACPGPEQGCCHPPYVPGDKVELLVANPSGATGLPRGSSGTVVCCNPYDPDTPIFVSWDDWAGGTSADPACEAEILSCPSYSGWWVACHQVGRLSLPDLFDGGEASRNFAPQTVDAGVPGQSFTIQGSIGNQGAAASGTVVVDLYASRDTRITDADFCFGRASMEIPAGGAASMRLNRDFPTDIPAGSYYIGWIIDPEDEVTESDEHNNVAFKSSYLLTVVGRAQNVLYVDDDAEGANDGSTWADAFTRLQDALAAAVQGSEIRVAQGVYKPDAGTGLIVGDRTASFVLKSHVAVHGGYAGLEAADPDARDVEAYPSILSGDLNGDDRTPVDRLSPDEPTRAENSLHVVRAQGVNASTILDGVVISGGNAYGFSDGELDGDQSFGGGLMLRDASCVVSNCVLTANSAAYGGGGLYSHMASPTLVNCTFHDNAVNMAGGGMRCAFGKPVVVSCRFLRNTALAGGGIYAYAGMLKIANSAFSGNMAEGQGGAVTNSGVTSVLEMTNCTLSGNLAGDSGGGLHHLGGRAKLTNCILWGNNGADPVRETAQVDGGMLTADRCCVEGWTGELGGTSTIGEDPMLVDADGEDDIVGTEDDDLRLSCGSPCIDTADNRTVPTDDVDLDADRDYDERLPWDLCGQARFMGELPTAEDRGQGVLPPVDMGAYEFQPLSPLFRFWSPSLSRHFFTLSDTEREKLVYQYGSDWTYEGVAYHTFAQACEPGLAPVYRFWSDGLSSHFYTIDEAEKNKLIENYSDVWRCEGTAFYAYREGREPPAARAVHRFWSVQSGCHFYTMSEREAAKLMREFAHVWNYEGIAWYAYE